VAEGYWEDVGTHEKYLQAQADVLKRRVAVEIDAFELAPGVWVGEGAHIDPGAVLRGPLYIGAWAQVEAAELGEFCVLGTNVVVKNGAFLDHAVSFTTTSTSSAHQPARMRDRQELRRHARRSGE